MRACVFVNSCSLFSNACKCWLQPDQLRASVENLVASSGGNANSNSGTSDVSPEIAGVICTGHVQFSSAQTIETRVRGVPWRSVAFRGIPSRDALFSFPCSETNTNICVESIVDTLTLFPWNNLSLESQICVGSGVSSVALALCARRETRSDWLRRAAAPRKAKDATTSVGQCSIGCRRRTEDGGRRRAARRLAAMLGS